MAPLEPTQVQAPSNTGAMIGAASSALGAIGGFMGNQAPDPGPMFGGGGASDILNSNVDYNIGTSPSFSGNWMDMSSYVGGSSFFGS